MNTKSLLTVVVLLTSGIVAQAQSNPPAKKEGTRTAKSAAGSVPASDIAAIRAASRALVSHALARDWSSFAQLFTDDAIMMAPNEPARVGRKNIEAQSHSNAVLKECTNEPIEFDGRGDLVFARGRYAVVVTAPNQPDVRDSGKFFQLWRKQSDGSWKLFRDNWNSDLPSPAVDTKITAARKAAWEKRPPGAKVKGAGTLSARDQDAIRDAWKALGAAGLARNWSKLAQFYSDDTAVFPPHAAASMGRSQAVEGWQKFPPYKDWRVEPLEIGGHGDFAYVRGEWSMVMTPANQPEQPGAGKYLQIWRKQPDGAWKLFRDIWNSDLPQQ
ncbi:MAG: DUF4440 domain-containing protein [Opitutaceae bacterium]|nr:DUF4440 domain-containing protein [Opitutaceae bacterium]